MYFSEADQQLLSRHRSGLLMHYPHIMDDPPSPAIDIGAVRFVIMMQSKVRGGVDKDSQILFGKLAIAYPEHADTYAVSWTWLPYVAPRPSLNRLLDHYIQSQRQGQWPNVEFESIMRSLRVVHMGRSPYFIHRPTMDAFIKAIDDQNQAASRTSIVDKLKGNPTVNLDEMADLSVEERKSMMSKGVSQCFLCGSIKPRKVDCLVCGYRPTR